MTPSLLDLTASLTAPMSMIAPKEVIGNVKFPSLLGEFQEGALTEPGVARVASNPSLSKATPDFDGSPANSLATLQLPLDQSGKSLPSSGTSLPVGLPKDQVGLFNGAAHVADPASSQTPASDLAQDAKLGSAEAGSIQSGRAWPRFEFEDLTRGDLSSKLLRPSSITGESDSLLVAGPVSVASIEPASDHSSQQGAISLAGRALEFALPISRAESELELTDQAKPDSIMQDPLHQAIEQKPVTSVTQPKDAEASEVLDARSLDAADGESNPPRDQEASFGTPASPIANLQDEIKQPTGIVRPTVQPLQSEPVAFRMAAASEGLVKAETQLRATSDPDIAPAKTAKEAAPINNDGLSRPQPENVGPVESRPSSVPVQIASTAIQVRHTAKDDVQHGKTAQHTHPRVTTDLKASQTGSSNITINGIAQTLAPVLDEVETDPDAPRLVPSLGLTVPSGSNAATPNASQLSLDGGSPQQSSTQPSTLAVSVAPSPQQTGATPASDASAAFRPSPQIESTIDQLTQSRSDAKANRPELTVRHQEFGAINMRFDAGGGGDLRATLSARDPGFVPAIQTALAERGIAATSETSGSGAQRGNDQPGSYPGAQGQGWNLDRQYGSSTGAGQGTSQPYSGQTQTLDEEIGSDQASRPGDRGGILGDGERFA